MFQAWATGHPKVNPACAHRDHFGLLSRPSHGGLCKLAFHAIIVTFLKKSRQCLKLLSNAYWTDLLVS